MSRLVLLTPETLARIEAAVQRVEKMPRPVKSGAGFEPLQSQPRYSSGTPLRYGTATADWSSGNSVTLTPCVSSSDSTATGEANVDCYIVSPPGVSPINVDISSGDIVAYLPFGASDGNGKEGICVNVMFGTYSTVGTVKYQVYQMTTDTAAGWDWVRAH